ncbi:porin family protein [Chondrinema litorale]|uniref:porin family protein n=1 Tax=Chondrinema litorale TaxID=2994555 RepID=UPI002542B9F6|nr:porin family protein [Chondrinema litorale]UZR96412.1 porin family protein [Chondrinema litorale]
METKIKNSAIQLYTINPNRFGFTIICLLLLAINVKAQDVFPKSSFGLKAGVNLNSWTNEFPFYTYEGQELYPDDWETTYGFHFGAVVNIRLSQLVAIEPGIMYTMKGTGLYAEAGNTRAEATVESNYLDIPFLLRLYVSDGFNLFVGPQMGYHLNSAYDLTVGDISIVEKEDISNDINELDFAGVLGLGYEFESGFNINISGELGFNTVDGYDYLDTYNRTIRFSMGYLF